MFNKLLLLFLLVSFYSCKKADETINKSDSQIETEKKADVKFENSDLITDSLKNKSGENQGKEKIFEGICKINTNTNTNTFLDCQNPDIEYLVNDETSNLKSLYEKIYSSKNVYGSVYAKVKGVITETKDEKFSEKFPMTLIVSEVIDIQKKNFNNTCVKYDFWAIGNEPTWSLQISKKENLILFNDNAGNKEYYFFYEEQTSDDEGRIIYMAHNKIQQYLIKAVFIKEKCSDNMSDKVYDYSAEIELSGGKIYKGCGIKGKE